MATQTYRWLYFTVDRAAASFTTDSNGKLMFSHVTSVLANNNFVFYVITSDSEVAVLDVSRLWEQSESYKLVLVVKQSRRPYVGRSLAALIEKLETR